jgi:hypothetical protein
MPSAASKERQPYASTSLSVLCAGILFCHIILSSLTKGEALPSLGLLIKRLNTTFMTKKEVNGNGKPQIIPGDGTKSTVALHRVTGLPKD